MKNGFTLIELLAVIVILALLAIIAVPSAINISNNIKKNMYCEKVDLLLTDAKRWGDDHLSELKEECYMEVSISYLVEQGITNKENNEGAYITNPYTSSAMDSDTIGIYKKNRRAYAFYTLNTSGLRDDVVAELENACEENRLCEDGETEEENNCIKRPANKC